MITRDDIARPITDDELDELLAERIKHDDPDREALMAKRLTWALEAGVGELSLYIDLASMTELSVLYREYAVAFALYHLHRTTSGGTTADMQASYDTMHKNLGLAHRGERLPGMRSQPSVIEATVIVDESSCSIDKLHGLV